MKYFLVLIFLLLGYYDSNSQDSLIIKATSLTENLNVYKDSLGIDKIGQIPNDKAIFLIAPAGRLYFLVYGGGKVGYASNVMLDYDKRGVAKLSRNNLDSKIEIAKRLEKESDFELKKIRIADSIKNHNEVKQSLEKGLKDILQVLAFNFYRNEIVVDFDIMFANFNRKSIKYLWLTIAGYNDVDDIEETKIFKCVGPIGFISHGKYSFDNAFYSRVISKLKIVKVSVVYMDGSKKDFSGKHFEISIAE